MANTALPDQPSPWGGLQTVLWKRDSLYWNVSDKLGNKPKLRHHHLTLGKSFTARNIAQVAGLRIIWTDNVLDHLSLSDGDTTLHIFHHVFFLKIQRHRDLTRNIPALLPNCVDEILETLILLFPESDSKTQQWLQIPCKDYLYNPTRSGIVLDSNLAKCGDLLPEHRRFDHFHYYRDRLVMLKELVDELAPASSTAMRILKGRRKGDLRFQSWVAIVVIGMTLLFGLIQSIEGGIQVYKSYHPTPAQN